MDWGEPSTIAIARENGETHRFLSGGRTLKGKEAGPWTFLEAIAARQWMLIGGGNPGERRQSMGARRAGLDPSTRECGGGMRALKVLSQYSESRAAFRTRKAPGEGNELQQTPP